MQNCKYNMQEQLLLDDSCVIIRLAMYNDKYKTSTTCFLYDDGRLSLP